MLNVETQYVESSRGELCLDIGASPILGQGECSAAFPFIHSKYPQAENAASATILPNYQDKFPRGCFYYLEVDLMHWNSHLTGSRNSDCAQICKEKGKERKDICF